MIDRPFSVLPLKRLVSTDFDYKKSPADYGWMSILLRYRKAGMEGALKKVKSDS